MMFSEEEIKAKIDEATEKWRDKLGDEKLAAVRQEMYALDIEFQQKFEAIPSRDCLDGGQKDRQPLIRENIVKYVEIKTKYGMV